MPVIRASSHCQLHPLLVGPWVRRLPPRMVRAADGHPPGRATLSGRGGSGDLRRRLREAPTDGGGGSSHGHDRATWGGPVPADLARLLEGLGVVA